MLENITQNLDVIFFTVIYVILFFGNIYFYTRMEK